MTERALETPPAPAEQPLGTAHGADALPEVLFIDDLARVLRMSRRSIERMRRHRTFPIPTLDALGKGRPRWSRVVVERFLAGESTMRRGLVKARAVR
jgi:hypothetical protein